MEKNAAYQKTLEYLYNKLPMFSRVGAAALKNNLDNIIKLCDALNNPQEKFKSIHIAGTNGKGSTSHMLAAVLQDSNYKVGLYTSPHLVDFRERIKINGKEISEEWVVNFVADHHELIETVQPSFFEITVAMAFLYFAEEGIDIAVIETGLGGRLDSTNIILPILSIITNINYDHKHLLGNTLKEIATEKAGIIKPNVPVLIGEQHPETERVFFENALHKKTTVYYAEALWDLVRTGKDNKYQYYKAIHKAHREMYDLHTDLLGEYQQHNIKTVLAATELLIANQGLNITVESTINALHKVKKMTGLLGRWDCLNEKPLVIADVAHNAAGLKEVLQQWNEIKASKKHIVLGFVKDKDVQEALSLFSKDCIYYFCNANIERALPVNELYNLAMSMELNGTVYPSVANAVNAAKEALNNEDALLITGSFFVVGEAMEFLTESEVEKIAN